MKQLPPDEFERLGSKYTDAEELFTALDELGGTATLMLRASWLKQQKGGRLPKRGSELPPEATITVAELREIQRKSRAKFAKPVIAVSHFWRTKENPDPDGETLEWALLVTFDRRAWTPHER